MDHRILELIATLIDACGGEHEQGQSLLQAACTFLVAGRLAREL
jgi:hypothetical protein